MRTNNMRIAYPLFLAVLVGCGSTAPTSERPAVDPQQYPVPDYSGVVDAFVTTDLDAQEPRSAAILIKQNDPSFTPPRLAEPMLQQRAVRSVLNDFTCPVRGRVAVAAIVDKDGTIFAPQLRRGIHEACDAKAIEAVRNVRMTPAMLNGEPVAMALTLPINFE